MIKSFNIFSETFFIIDCIGLIVKLNYFTFNILKFFIFNLIGVIFDIVNVYFVPISQFTVSVTFRYRFTMSIKKCDSFSFSI